MKYLLPGIHNKEMLNPLHWIILTGAREVSSTWNTHAKVKRECNTPGFRDDGGREVHHQEPDHTVHIH